MVLWHTSTTPHVRVASQANHTKLHFSFQTHEAARFPGQISRTRRLSSSPAKKLESLCMSVKVYSNDPNVSSSPLVIKTTGLYMGIFVKVHHLLFSMRHRLTVAGNNERLFYLLFFSPFVIFFQQQNCYIKCA